MFNRKIATNPREKKDPNGQAAGVNWQINYYCLSADFAADWTQLRASARSLGVTLLPVEARGPTEFESSFSTIVAVRADALITFSDAVGYVHRQRLADLAFQHRLAMMTPFQETTSAGGLISYGPSLLGLCALRQFSSTESSKVPKRAT
jgi:hypothetical protein